MSAQLLHSYIFLVLRPLSVAFVLHFEGAPRDSGKPLPMKYAPRKLGTARPQFPRPKARRYSSHSCRLRKRTVAFRARRRL